MTASINSYAARENGSEDFLPEQGWISLLEFLEQTPCLIWGRKTYEAVSNWNDDAIRTLDKFKIILVSSDNDLVYPKENVSIASNPLAAIDLVKRFGFDQAILSGGPTLNGSFIKEGLVDEIILNYNPVLVSKGKNVFNGDFDDVNLTLAEVKELGGGIIQVKYCVRED